MDLAALEDRLGYTFAQRMLLEQAVTHRSHGAVHNERLEFLGDAVLNCAIAQLLFAKYARLDEGDLSRLRANLAGGGEAVGRALTLEAMDAIVSYALFSARNVLPPDVAERLSNTYRTLQGGLA